MLSSTKLLLFSYAGVDISATFSGAVILSICYRYLYSVEYKWLHTLLTMWYLVWTLSNASEFYTNFHNMSCCLNAKSNSQHGCGVTVLCQYCGSAHTITCCGFSYNVYAVCPATIVLDSSVACPEEVVTYTCTVRQEAVLDWIVEPFLPASACIQFLTTRPSWLGLCGYPYKPY